jgi:hypothetical protein
MIRKCTLLILVLLLAACGDKRTISVQSENVSYQKSVLNGTAVDVAASPQFVKISIPLISGEVGQCSGTVVGVNSVLTAGHCFVNSVPGAIVEHPLIGSLAIKEFVVHPYYREEPTLGAIFFDIAIVHTNAPLGLPQLGIEASLPMQAGERGVVFGFGVSDSADSPLSAGEVPVDLVTPNHIFSVNAGGAEPCYGDSGGPLLKEVFDENGALSRVTIAGVVSTGSKVECGEGDLTLFTNIQDVDTLNFLRANTPDALIF